ncbi:MAG: hypothetical protein RR357_00605 [Clostridia bacterium]
MNFNPLSLLPMLMSGNGENNKNMDMQKMMSMMTALQGGEPSSMLEMLGGGNEKLSGMLQMMKLMPNMMNSSSKSTAQPTAENSEQKKQSAPNFDAVNGFSNNEINQALFKLMNNK